MLSKRDCERLANFQLPTSEPVRASLRSEGELKPFGYTGSKSQILDLIYDHIGSHTVFVDAFGGSGIVSLSKSVSPVEVYNDASPDLVNLMRVLRDEASFTAFKEALPSPSSDFFQDYQHSLISYGFIASRANTRKRTVRTEMQDFPASNKIKITCDALVGSYEYADPVGMAAAYFIIQIMAPFRRGMGYRSTAAKKGIINNAATFKNREKLVSRLDAIHSRLANVILLNTVDFSALIARFGSPATTFYLDPPYLPETRRTSKQGDYGHEMLYEDHDRLISHLLENFPANGQAMISGYPSKLYGRLEDGKWSYSSRQVRYGTRKDQNEDTHETYRRECLWVSPVQ